MLVLRQRPTGARIRRRTICRKDFASALRAGFQKLCSALGAELLRFGIFRLALRAIHDCSPGFDLPYQFRCLKKMDEKGLLGLIIPAEAFGVSSVESSFLLPGFRLVGDTGFRQSPPSPRRPWVGPISVITVGHFSVVIPTGIGQIYGGSPKAMAYFGS